MASEKTTWLSTAARVSLAVGLGLALAAPGVRAEPPPRAGGAGGGGCPAPPGGSLQPASFDLDGVSWPSRPGVIAVDTSGRLQVRYRGARPARLLRTWTEALRCAGWTVESRGARGADAQAWLTHADHPDAIVITAAGAGGVVEVDVERMPRVEVDSAWLPASLASPRLAPAGAELRRREGSENFHGRHLLHVAYASSTTVRAVEDAWTAELAARGWRLDVVAGQRYFTGPDGVVMLGVWRGLGAVELNLHRVTDQDPGRQAWSDRALALVGVARSSRADPRTGDHELQSVAHCSDVSQGAGRGQDLLGLYDEALVRQGWRRVGGRRASAEADGSGWTSVYRAGDRQVVLSLGVGEYCARATLTHRPYLSRAALGPPWAGDDWPAMAGTSGIVVEATAGDRAQRARLVVEHRIELLGLGAAQQALCPALTRKLTGHWAKALRRRGWRTVGPGQATLARGQETVDLDLACDHGVATVTLSR